MRHAGTMTDAVIVDAVRTPLGRRNGMLAGWHPVDLAAHTLRALVERNDLDPALVDDVIMGCVMQVGDQALNIGRNAALAAGFPDTVPGTSIDRQCGSSQQALHFAAQGVIAGAYDVVIAAGIESMSRVPMGSSLLPGRDPFGPVAARPLSGPGAAGPLGRADRRAVEPHPRGARRVLARVAPQGRPRDRRGAIRARDRGRAGHRTTPRRCSSSTRESAATRRWSASASLKPAFKPDGVVTAGNSSQITDGAAAVLVTSEEAASRLGLRPRARFDAFALAGADPVLMLTAPIPATAKVLERGKRTLDDMDLIEINEAFASVVLAWEREVHPDPVRVNVNGGAIALGHPLGCSGARLMTTLLCELERSGGRFGLQTMCEGGGMANAAIIETALIARATMGSMLGMGSPRRARGGGRADDLRDRRVDAAQVQAGASTRAGSRRHPAGEPQVPLRSLRRRGHDDGGPGRRARCAPALPGGHGLHPRLSVIHYLGISLCEITQLGFGLSPPNGRKWTE